MTAPTPAHWLRAADSTADSLAHRLRDGSAGDAGAYDAMAQQVKRDGILGGWFASERVRDDLYTSYLLQRALLCAP